MDFPKHPLLLVDDSVPDFDETPDPEQICYDIALLWLRGDMSLSGSLGENQEDSLIISEKFKKEMACFDYRKK